MKSLKKGQSGHLSDLTIGQVAIVTGLHNDSKAVRRRLLDMGITTGVKVKIKYIPARLNEVFCPHLMWHDGEYTYDFWAYGHLKPYQILWHKGRIRKNEYDYYDKCIKTLKEWKERGK